MLDYDSFRPKQAAALAAGKHIGFGIAFELTPESADIPGTIVGGYDTSTVKMDPSGRVTLLTGVTTMRLDAGLDTGPMLLAEMLPIAPEENALDLYESLAVIGAPLMVRTLAGLEDGSVEPIEQNHNSATLAPILTRDDGHMDFTRTATDLHNRWRGFQPWPGAWTTLRGRKLIVHRMCVGEGTEEAGVLHVEDHKLGIGCGGSSLELLEVQMEGKRRMTAEEFLRGFQVKSGERVDV